MLAREGAGESEFGIQYSELAPCEKSSPRFDRVLRFIIGTEIRPSKSC